MAHTNIKMYGTTWCSDCKRTKKFFGEQRVHYKFVDIDGNAEGERIVAEANNGKHIIPTIFFDDGSVLAEPTNAELAAKLGLETKPQSAFYDLAIVGGGPAGLTAALYAAREGIETLVVERSGLGGQAGVTERLDNYPGFPEGISGADFADRLAEQCRRFGVELLSAVDATTIDKDDEYTCLNLSTGAEVRAWALLLAPGSTYRRLDVPGEDDFIGAGVHFCATCDGPFYRGKEVLVIGGGNSAVEEGLFLTKFASKVTIVSNMPKLTASQVAIEKALRHNQVDVLYNTSVAEFRGKDGKLAEVVLKNAESGDEQTHEAAAVFVFIGLQPNTAFLERQVELQQHGFIVTDAKLETSVPGVFAAGDARAGSTKQLVSAAGEGATSALMIRQYLEERKAAASRRAS